jgi:hypothetical protein
MIDIATSPAAFSPPSPQAGLAGSIGATGLRAELEAYRFEDQCHLIETQRRFLT